MSNSLYAKDYALLIRLLRELRVSLGVTQTQLAAALGKTQAYVSKCERCERRLDLIEMIQYCEALDTRPYEFIHRFLDHRRRQFDAVEGRPDGDAGTTVTAPDA